MISRECVEREGVRFLSSLHTKDTEAQSPEITYPESYSQWHLQGAPLPRCDLNFFFFFFQLPHLPWQEVGHCPLSLRSLLDHTQKSSLPLVLGLVRAMVMDGKSWGILHSTVLRSVHAGAE